MNMNDSGMTMISNDDIEKYVSIIKTQTTYDDSVANQKLRDFNYDYMKVIRDYMGIRDKKETKVKSINQEIYKQIRYSLDATMREYREKNPVDLEQVRTNLQESEEKEKREK